MKTWLKAIVGPLLGALALTSAVAQQQPVLTVTLTDVAVLTNGNPPGTVAFVDITNVGTGYTSAPNVVIAPPGGGGTQATAIATISLSGQLASLTITNEGSGYATPPLIFIDPPPPPPAGGVSVGAAARAYLGTHFFQPNQNESFGPAEVPIGMTALAVGTFPAGGFSYEFFVNGISVGVAVAHPPAGTPATVGWTPPQPGAYFLTVKASDGAHEATSLPVRYFATGTTMVSPTPNTLVPIGSSVVLQATAMPQPLLASGTSAFVQRIEFWADGVKIAEDLTAPYSSIYRPGVVPTTHVVQARAFDNEGNLIAGLPGATESLLMVSPIGGVDALPTCTISSPANDKTIAIPGGGPDIPIAVGAASPIGFIQKVELYIDGVLFGTDTTFPYSFNWHPTIVGDFRLVALAYDDKQNVVASTSDGLGGIQPVPTLIHIVAQPTVTLIAPDSSTAIGVGSPVTLTAAADDSNVGGTIAKVQFFVGATMVAESNTPVGNQYSATWTPTTEGGATITAVAINAFGISRTSAPLTVTVSKGGGGGGGTIGQPPTVSVTGPTSATQLPVNQPVLITAIASDVDGNVANVQFFVNTQAVGTTSAYPYSASWTPSSLGSYTITAKATDNDGNQVTSADVVVTVVDPSPSAPSVSVTSPANGASLTAGNPATIQATATDDVSIASVQFFINGQATGAADAVFPYSLPWTPTSPGSYTLVARAKDNVGNQTTSAPVVVTVSSGAAPNVALTSPAMDITVGAGSVVNLAATASDADGAPPSVRFFANGIQVGSASAAPYLANWTPSAAGTYRVEAQATDSAGNISSSSAVTVTVSGNGAPAVSITSPTVGTSVPVGTSTMINASATDADGLVSYVTFYANGVMISTDNSPPYIANWVPNSAGTYRLTAMAVDNSGASTVSPAVVVIAGEAGGGVIDTFASGIYIGTTATGSFTAVNLAGASVTFIGYVPANQPENPAKTIYFSDVPVDSSGAFELTDGHGVMLISGQFSGSGVSGTFRDGDASIAFNGPNTFAQSTATVRSGYYNGSIAGSNGSMLTGLIGLDGKITLYVKDGTLTDAGAAAVSSAGAFLVTTRLGNKIRGTIDQNTGLMIGSIERAGGGGSATFAAAPSSGASFSDGSLRNISTRAQVGTGDAVLIAGFVIDSSAPKRVLIRAVGPGLAAQGVPAGAVLANPTLTIHRLGHPTPIANNDDWGSGAPNIGSTSTQVGAFALSAGSLDAATLLQLSRGAYTATVKGADGGTGIALLELYDTDNVQAFSGEKMVNISSRGQIGTGDQILIAGFVVNGAAPKKVLIRGVGPALGALGVAGSISDPVLRLDRLVNHAWVLVRENDNWETGNDASLIRGATVKVGATPALPSGSKDSALLLVLPPGAYSAQLSGAASSTGVGLIEVYEVQ